MMVPLQQPERLTRSGLVDTVRFVCAHPSHVAGVCLLAAAARFVQAGWAESLPPGGSLALELAVAVARLALVLTALGEGGLGRGIQAVRAFIAQPEADRAAWFVRLVEQARSSWRQLLIDGLGVLVIALLLNLLLGHLAALSAEGAGMAALVETPEAARSATFLFLKNVSVIPLVLLVQIRLVMLLAR